MTDPRNVAHDKRVAQEKKHHGQVAGNAHPARPGRKPHTKHEPQLDLSGHAPDLDEPVDRVESGQEDDLLQKRTGDH